MIKRFVPAADSDLPFIAEVYNENVNALHGVHRSLDDWKRLFAKAETAYYIVHTDSPSAWFRIDREDGGFWLDMLQVKPCFFRQGIGRYVLSVAELMAKAEGFDKIGVHTTEDNLAALSLYTSVGYTVAEKGPCTTADGVERLGYTLYKKL